MRVVARVATSAAARHHRPTAAEHPQVLRRRRTSVFHLRVRATYRLPRFGDNPLIDVVLVDRKDLPSAGAGETPIVGLAPAVANAIFNATGVRLRSLPLAPKGIQLVNT